MKKSLSVLAIVHLLVVASRLGYAQDNADAVRKSAEQGYAQDNVDAVRKSAEQGNAAAQLKLGDMYEQGNGVPQNHQEAAKWYIIYGETLRKTTIGQTGR